MIHVVSIIKLKQLLTSILKHSVSIGFRYKLDDDVWRTNFLKVTQLTERGIILELDAGSRLFFIPDLSAIIQFEFDSGWCQCNAYCHYNVFADTACIPVQKWLVR